MALKVAGLKKSFDGKEVLGGIDFEVADGEVAALLGPSGCGKTSLLRIIAGLSPSDGGSLRKDEDRVSFVFQEPRLLPGLSAYDNIRVPLLGVAPPDEAASKALKFLELIGLASRAKDKPRKLSGGMRQRLSLARGFAYPAGLLLMDEPFQSMDIALRGSLMDAFIRLWTEEPRSVLFVTHDPEEALYLGDSILVMGESPARIVDRISVPGKRGERKLSELLDAEKRVYSSLLGASGIWSRKEDDDADRGL